MTIDLFNTEEDKIEEEVVEIEESKISFPVFFKIKETYTTIDENGDFMEIGRKGCICHFIFGNRLVQRLYKENDKDKIDKDLFWIVEGLQRRHSEITQEEFNEAVADLDKNRISFLKGEMREKFVKEKRENDIISPPEDEIIQVSREYLNSPF